MRLPFVATALLIVPLAACGSADTGGPDAPPTTATATEAAAETLQSAERSPAEPTQMIAPVQANDTTCGADKLGRWLNALPTEDIKVEIAAQVGDRPIRYYAQGDPITMDYSEARLNVELGADGRIKLFRCG